MRFGNIYVDRLRDGAYSLHTSSGVVRVIVESADHLSQALSMWDACGATIEDGAFVWADAERRNIRKNSDTGQPDEISNSADIVTHLVANELSVAPLASEILEIRRVIEAALRNTQKPQCEEERSSDDETASGDALA